MSAPVVLLSIPGFSEPFSSLSHLAGVALFAWLGVSLVRRGRGDAGRMLSLIVFAFSCVLLLSMSGVYHLLSPSGVPRYVLHRLDHAAIFILIAGSFTPVHAILFRGAWRWGMLAIVWTMAITAITLKTIYFESMPEWLGLALYLGLGWFGLVSGIAMARRFGFRFIRPVVWSALAYTFGALADFLHWPQIVPGIFGPHELFHLAVLAGIAFHWKFVFSVASGDIPAERRSTGIDLAFPVARPAVASSAS